jgi:hypothetical protein
MCESPLSLTDSVPPSSPSTVSPDSGWSHAVHDGPISATEATLSIHETSAHHILPQQSTTGVHAGCPAASKAKDSVRLGLCFPPDSVVAQKSRQIRDQLVDDLHRLRPDCTLEEFLDQCISLFMEHRFPATPVCPESPLRANTSLQLRGDGDQDVPLSCIRAFTLLTALCALTMYTVPSGTFVMSQHTAPLFFQASRDMFNLHHEAEIEHLDWTTLAIWILHGSSLYTIGRTRLAWHSLGQLRWAVQELRLYDEATYENLDPLNAQILRYQFSMIFIADKALPIIGDQTIGLDELSMQRIVTAETFNGGTNKAYLLDTGSKFNLPIFEEQLMQGFAMARKLWAAAGSLVVLIRAGTTTKMQLKGTKPTTDALSRIRDSYLQFTSILDDLPPWLQNPELIREYHPEAFQYQNSRFWGQRADLLVSFHSLKLIILLLCIQHDVLPALGLNDDIMTLGLRKLELAQDFLRVVQNVPFSALQANGESCVGSRYCLIPWSLTHNKFSVTRLSGYAK